MLIDPFNAFLDYPQTPVLNKKSGALSGLTLAVKDIYDVAGYPSGWGNPFRAQEAPAASTTAPSVAKLLEAGARFVGKTQTDELAFSLMGQNAHYPHPINPRAPDRITGGSSSGSAAAVAGGLADIAIGSDTGGSIRAPASFCGLIGLRVTHGAISLDGAMPLAPSFDVFGWFAKDMASYRAVADILLGQSAVKQATPRLYRSAALEALLTPEAQPEYERIIRDTQNLFGSAREIGKAPQSIDALYWCMRRLQGFEAWRSHGAWLQAGDRKLGPGVKDRFEFGATISEADVLEEAEGRMAFSKWLKDALGDDGYLVQPTVPSAAPFSADSHDDLQKYREQALRLLCWSGLSGLPQLSLPLGAVGGAPFGISILGPKDSDLALLDLGVALLQGTGD